jgi:hypothetical protein
VTGEIRPWVFGNRLNPFGKTRNIRSSITVTADSIGIKCGGEKLPSENFINVNFRKHNRPGKFLLIFLTAAMAALLSLPPAAFAQQEVSPEALDDYRELKMAAREKKIEEAVQEDSTGTDPRAFTDKFMPFYRFTELENGATQQSMTALGTVGFSPSVGMFYEVPLSVHTDLPGSAQESIGMGDVNFKFLIKPKAWEFTYGKDGEKKGNVMWGTDYTFSTATDDAAGGNSFLFAPILAVVLDMPFHGFLAALNLYYFDVFKDDLAPDTSRYVGKWYYMQPLTRPGPWYGGLFLLPEFQPVYDFETEDFSSWFGLEIGKLAGEGKIAYIKPGWGIDNSEPTDRKSTFEAGFRWFF